MATTFYPSQSPVFYTRTTAISWHGTWDQEAVKADISPAYTGPGRGNPITPSGTAFPLMALLTYKAGASGTIDTLSDKTVTTTPYTIAMYRGISDPLAAQTFGGTVDLIWGVTANAAFTNAISFKLAIYVLEGQTDTVRGTLVEITDTNLWAASVIAGTALSAPAAVSAVTAEQGDRLLLELGCSIASASTNSPAAQLWFGAVANHQPMGDLTVGSANVGTQAASLTFSQTVQMQTVTLAATDVVAGNEELFVYTDAGALKAIRVSIGSDGEGSGVGLLDGTLWTPHAARGAEHYDANLGLLTTVDTDPGLHQPHVVRQVPFATDGTVYVGNPNKGGPCDSDNDPPDDTTALIQRIQNGAVTGTWSPAIEYSGVPSFFFQTDGDTIYYTSLGPTVKAYRLSDSTQLSDIVTLAPLTFDGSGNLVSGTFFRGIQCLQDGTFVVSSVTYTASAPSASDVRHYSRTGTLLSSYTVVDQVDWGSVTVTTDQSAVWAANTGNSTICPPMIVKWRLTDGTALVTITGNDQVLDTTTGAHLCSGGLCVIPVRMAIDPLTPVTIPIRRLRRSPHLSVEQFRIFYHRFQLDLMPGVGTLTGQGVTPLVMLRWSDDGGYTWSSEIELSAGAQGDYRKRVYALMLGSGRDRVFEVSTSDPVQWTLLAAYIDSTPGTN
jgi:hypothetical protein